MLGPRRRGARTGATVTVVVVALVAAGLLTWRLSGADATYTAPPARADARQADPVAAARALAGLRDAITDRDATAAAALAPRGDAAAAALLGQVVGNARALDVVDFTARYVDEAGGLGADGAWPAAVDLAWRFDGFDAQPVHEEVQVTFEGTGASVGIVGFGGGDDRSPLWLSGPLQVRRADRTLVLATTSSDADLLAERAAQAVTVVHRVLPRWAGGLVVEVPGSEEQLDDVLGVDPDSYTEIAAVTASVDGTTTPRSPVHVFVNPTLYDTLDPIGGQVVISHETTHVATSAPLTGSLPNWLEEGFADFVALRDVPLPITTTAGQIIAQVARSGPPDHLPDAADFDEHATYLGATYEAAWLACRELADEGGESALVRFYQQVSAGRPLTAELREQFGLTEQQLLVRWQQQLRDLAAGSKAAS